MAWESSDNSQWESSPEPRPLFQEVLRCFPIKRYENSHLETGDKIMLPPSSLSLILYNRIQYPLVFKLQSYKTNAISYSGVMEFDAEEGNVYLLEWTMQNLNIQEGESIVVSNAPNVLRGHYMKLRPHKTAFAELADPRAVLEKVLREFTCLGRGSTIVIKYNRVDFYFDVLEVSPGGVITLIDINCEVEFAPPLEYNITWSLDRTVVVRSNGRGLGPLPERGGDWVGRLRQRWCRNCCRRLRLKRRRKEAAKMNEIKSLNPSRARVVFLEDHFDFFFVIVVTKS
ncbi:hypothetical protein ACP275_05G139500 [Erythranthe tilingii]